jgi:hypothetical protein
MKLLHIIALLALVGLFFGCTKSIDNEHGDIIVGGDRDEHGCIGSAGYVWCESLNECIRPFEKECPEDINDEPVLLDEDLTEVEDLISDISQMDEDLYFLEEEIEFN